MRRAATFALSLMLVMLAMAAPVAAAQPDLGPDAPAAAYASAPQAVEAAASMAVTGPSLAALLAAALALALAGILLRLRERRA